MKIVALIRHGEQVNKRADTGLTPLGIQQAEATGAHLAEEIRKMSPEGVKRIKGIFSTKSIRTWKTAEIVASSLGNLRIVPDARLSEQMTDEAFTQLTDEQRAEMLLKSGHDKNWKPEFTGVDGKPVVGDSAAEAVERFTAFLRELPDAPAGEEPYIYLAFTHGGVTKEYLDNLPTEVTEGKWSGKRIEHCAITTVAMDREKVTSLEGVNDITHLKERGIGEGSPSAWRI